MKDPNSRNGDGASLKVIETTPRVNHFPQGSASRFPDKTEIKNSYTITQAWRDLGLEDDPARSCKSPLRDEKTASFSVFDEGRKFKDHGGDGLKGDVIDFVCLVRGCSFQDALRWISGQLGNTVSVEPLHARKSPAKKATSIGPSIRHKHLGTQDELFTLSRQRGFSTDALELAQMIGALRFGVACQRDCWLLGSSRTIEARRMDGEHFPHYGNLPSRKAHTIRGSRKDWPLGLESKFFRGDETILLVEGGPDYLAACDLMLWSGKPSWHPVAMLGKSVSIANEALELLAGKQVRIFPHIDGLEACARWTAQLQEVGCLVDNFTFESYKMPNGNDVCDLNDFLRSDASHSFRKEALS